MGKFISDVIGEEFKEWKRGDIIILAAPTGCGKSTFVLEKLLLVKELMLNLHMN